MLRNKQKQNLNTTYPVLRNSSPAYSLVNTKPSDTEKHPDKSPVGKRRKCSNPLIKQLHDGVKAGDINEPLTTHSVKQWISRCNIRKGDGTRYKESSVNDLLSNSYIKKKKTKNRNSKWLKERRLNKDGVYEYWFDY